MISITTASGELQLASDNGAMRFVQNGGTLSFSYGQSEQSVPVAENEFDFSKADNSMYLATF